MNTEQNCSEQHFLSLSASVQLSSILVPVHRWLKSSLIQVSVDSLRDSCSREAVHSSLFRLLASSAVDISTLWCRWHSGCKEKCTILTLGDTFLVNFLVRS